jgi:hypothetical protein
VIEGLPSRDAAAARSLRNDHVQAESGSPSTI